MAAGIPERDSGIPRPLLASLQDPELGVWRAGYLLVVIMIMASYAFCAAQTTPNPSPAALVIQLVTVAVVLRVAHMSRTIRRIGWSLVAVAVAVAGVLVVGITGTSGQWLDLTLSGMSAVAYLAAPVAIVIHQLRRRTIDGQALLAAISAYILIGMCYTFLYNFAALLIEESIFGTGEINSLGSQVFFSFTTLTTTGYGNLVPAGPLLQSVAIAEAMTGQLFLVIAVARIVTGLDPQTARELARDAKEARRARKAHEAGER